MSITKVILIVFSAVGVAYTLFLIVFNRKSKHIHILNADEFEKKLSETKDAQLIDVRTSREHK